MLILGIDPGIAITGFAIIEKIGHRHQHIECGAFLTPSQDPLPRRLHSLYQQLSQIIEKHQPETLAIEQLFFNKNVKTALTVGHARGVVLLCAESFNIPIFHYTPSEVKLAVCGYGKADKKQVQYMVKTLLNLDRPPKPDDVADACAIAICHSHSFKLKSLA